MADQLQGAPPFSVDGDDDELLIPRIGEQKLAKFAERGERRTYAAGEMLFEQGVREAPFIVLERGSVEFTDQRPEGTRTYRRISIPTFIGDIAMFTGEPAVVGCVAVEDSDVIVFDRSGLRAMLAEWPEMAEFVLRTMMLRRAWLEQHDLGMLRLIAPRASRRAFEVRDLLERNLLPVRWYDVDTDPESAALLDTLSIRREDTPVLIRHEKVYMRPSAAQVARELGLRAEVDGQRFDVVVLGGGPAGLAAAVYAGSEGLRTLVAEAWAPGGQAGTSTRIENYLGFPAGISGAELTRKATLQAQRFDAVLSSFHPAVEVVEGPEGLVRVDLDDGQHVLGRTVVVATGAKWRRLQADGIDRFMGAGVYHAASRMDARQCVDEDVVVIGGGNSAGQAATYLSRSARSVRVVVRRGDLRQTMSHYLVDRLERRANVEIVPNSDTIGFEGNGRLEQVVVRDRGDGAERRLAAAAAFVMIGADPCTEPVRELLATDRDGYVLCGQQAQAANGWGESRDAHLLETVRPGVFAAGDVRSGSTKRVASAVGDGALVVRFAHQVLDV